MAMMAWEGLSWPLTACEKFIFLVDDTERKTLVDGKDEDCIVGLDHSWLGKWMIGKEVTPVDGKDKDFLEVEE